MSKYANISSAAAADLSVERPNILDHVEGTVDSNLKVVTHIESVSTNTAVAVLGEAPTTAEFASSTVPVHPEVISGSSPSQPYPMEGTTKADHIMDDIAVFSATSPRPSLVCDWTLRSTHHSLDHNQGSLAVYKFAPGSYPSLQKSDNKKLNYAM